MHCVILAELAAFFAQQGPSLRQSQSAADGEILMRYWTANRVRHEKWHRLMTAFRVATHEQDFKTLRAWWSEDGLVLEEIVVSELLSRVVAAIGASQASSSSREPTEQEVNFDAVVRGVHQAQLEASHRAHQIILDASGATTSDIVRLNRLRHGAERWTDWLVGRAGGDLVATKDFCIDFNRATQFRDEVREGIHRTDQDITTWLMNASMREMLIRRTSDGVIFPDENRHVAESAIGLFRPELFDDFGVPKSLWLQRLQNGTERNAAHTDDVILMRQASQEL
ncbi:MAG: hypothetical protein AAF802_20475 [Planctomycetota bacterium]